MTFLGHILQVFEQTTGDRMVCDCDIDILPVFEQTTGDRMICDCDCSLVIYCRCLNKLLIEWSVIVIFLGHILQVFEQTTGDRMICDFEQTTGDRMVCDCDIPWSYTAGV